MVENSQQDPSLTGKNVGQNQAWSIPVGTSKIVKVRKNASGDITDVMVDNGNVFSIDEAILLARDQRIEGVHIGRAKNGREYLRSNANGIATDNLDNLPTF